MDVQISQALQRLAADPQMAIRLGQGGRKHVGNAFAPKVIYDRWERELFEAVS